MFSRSLWIQRASLSGPNKQPVTESGFPSSLVLCSSRSRIGLQQVRIGSWLRLQDFKALGLGSNVKPDQKLNSLYLHNQTSSSRNLYGILTWVIILLLFFMLVIPRQTYEPRQEGNTMTAQCKRQKGEWNVFWKCFIGYDGDDNLFWRLKTKETQTAWRSCDNGPK